MAEPASAPESARPAPPAAAGDAAAAIAVRAATSADAEPVARMITRLGAELSGAPPGTRPEADPAVLACARRMLALRGASHGLIAHPAGAADAAVGVMMVNERAAIRAGVLYGKLTELYVAPGWRGRGVASALIRAAAEMGRARGWTRLEVGAPATVDAERARRVFRVNGFAPAGDRLRLPL